MEIQDIVLIAKKGALTCIVQTKLTHTDPIFILCSKASASHIFR